MILTDLAAACRKSGLKVIEVDGWKTRGHGQMKAVETLVCHHTATARSAPGDYPSLRIVRDGRPDLSGPLAQLGLGRDGTVYVIAAGVCYHAGAVKQTSYDNWHAIGIEAEHDGISPWPASQVDAYSRLCAALAAHYRVPVSRVLGHKEVCAPTGRKSDPNFDMGLFRVKVATVQHVGHDSTDVVVSTNNVMSLPKNPDIAKTLAASTTTPTVVALQELDPASFKAAAEGMRGWNLVDMPADNEHAEGVMFDEAVWKYRSHRYVKQYDGKAGISYTRHFAVVRLHHKALGFDAVFISYHAVTSGKDKDRVAMRKSGLTALRAEIGKIRDQGLPLWVMGDYNSTRTQHPSASVKVKSGIDHVYFWAGKKVTASKRNAKAIDTRSDHDAFNVRFTLKIKEK